MKVTCTCGATNRLPAAANKRIACGRCQHVFTPRELANATPEAPPPPPAPDFSLEQEDDDVCPDCGNADCYGECQD